MTLSWCLEALIHLTGLAAVLEASLRLVLMTMRWWIGRIGFCAGKGLTYVELCVPRR